MTDSNIIPNSLTLRMSDRIARFVKDLKEGTSNLSMGTSLWDTANTAGDISFENQVQNELLSDLDIDIENTFAGDLFGPFYQALNQYVRSDLSYSSIDSFLTDYRIRVQEYFANAYAESTSSTGSGNFSASNVFPDQDKSVNTIGSVSYDGTGIATYTQANSGVLSSSFNPVLWVAKITNTFGATNVTFTASWYLDTVHSNTQTLSFIIPFGSMENTKVPLGETKVSSVVGTDITLTTGTEESHFADGMYVLLEGVDSNGYTIQEILQIDTVTTNDSGVLTCTEGIINADNFDSSIRVYPMMHGIESVSDSSTGSINGDAFTIIPGHDRAPAYGYTSQKMELSPTRESLVDPAQHAEGVLCKLDSGNYLEAFHEGSDHITLDHKVVYRIYDTTTNTWGSVTTIFDDEYADYLATVGVTDTGRVLLLFRRFDYGGTGHIDVSSMYSDDNGNTWSSRSTVSTSHVVAPTSKIIYVPTKGYMAAFSGDSIAAVLYTSDNGVTWGSQRAIYDGSYDPDIDATEPDIEYLGDGVLVSLFRNNNKNAGDMLEQCISTDYGFTWSSPITTNIAAPYFSTRPRIKYNSKHGILIVTVGDRRSEHGGDISEESIWVYYQDVSGGSPTADNYTLGIRRKRPLTSSTEMLYGYPNLMEIDDDNYFIIFTDRVEEGGTENADLFECKLTVLDTPKMVANTEIDIPE